MKSNLKKIIRICSLLVPLFLLASCGSEIEENSNSMSLSTDAEQKKFTISFEGVSKSDESIIENSYLYEPNAPQKDGYIFMGWFFDLNYNNEVSFPLKVTEDMVLYAKYESHNEAFINARENTIGKSINYFEYEYTINASAKALSQTFSGTTRGETKINKKGDVSFYDVHSNSGELFYDGTIYQIKKENDLKTIKENEFGSVTDFTNEKVEGEYFCGFNSFAKAIFTYSESDIVGLNKTTESNKYELITKKGISDIVSLIGNNLNNPLIEHFIINLPETSVQTNMYVSFDGKFLNSYSYEISVAVSDIELSLTYELNFKNIGKDNEIKIKHFDNVYFNNDEITIKKDEIYKIIETFLESKSSGYDFIVNTGVDYGFSTFEINSTFKGKAFRYREGNDIYFHNDIEIDSDYKNNDLYDDKGLKDIHIKKTKLSSNEVYIIEKKLFSDGLFLQENYESSLADEFYLLNSSLFIESISFIQVGEEKDNTIYSLGFSDNEASLLLEWLNAELELDPLKRTTEKIVVFGNFDKSSVKVENLLFEIRVDGDDFVSLKINCEGTYRTKFVGSRDFTKEEEAYFNFEISINANQEGETFKPYEKVEDAK